jgi:hypothetical protein
MGSDVLKTDVFIVGGGPAGLATGIALRQRRLSVVVADLARPPIDKACGEGLMPQTVAELKGLGVALGPSQAVSFRGIRFIGEGRVAEGAFPQGYGLGIRRTTLHQALVERAARSTGWLGMIMMGGSAGGRKGLQNHSTSSANFGTACWGGAIVPIRTRSRMSIMDKPTITANSPKMTGYCHRLLPDKMSERIVPWAGWGVSSGDVTLEKVGT